MKLLFIGLTPSADLASVLKEQRFPYQLLSKDSQTKGHFDLIAFAPSSKEDLEKVKALRKQSSKAWIVVAVDNSWLTDAAHHQALLACTDKNEVWDKSIWELRFWLSLQSLAQIKELRVQLESVKGELKDLQHLYNKLDKSSHELIEQIESDVDLATNIQRSLLPKFSPNIPGVSIAAKYLPASGLGGDYYDIFEFGDKKRFGMLIADSKTHGMAAALLSVLLKLSIEEMKDRFPTSSDFVSFLNQEILNAHRKEIAPLSLVYAIFDRTNLTLDITAAGETRPLLWRKSQPIQFPLKPGPNVGEAEKASYERTLFHLQPGDIFLLHTDGLLAAMKEDISSLFGRLTKSGKLNLLEVQNEILAQVRKAFPKETLPDDITIIQFLVDSKTLYLASQA